MTRLALPLFVLLTACHSRAPSTAQVGPLPAAPPLLERSADAGAVAAIDAAAPPAAIDNLSAPIREVLKRDLAAMEDPKAWLHRATFLGWTAPDHAVMEVVTCDVDSGGGRGPYCDLELCVVEALTQDPAEPACTELHSDNLSSSEKRPQLDADAIEHDLADALAALRPLHDGRHGSTSEAALQTKTTSHAIDVVLVLRGKRGSYLVHHIALDGRDPPFPTLGGIRVTDVVHAAEGPCTVVIGSAVLHDYYEAVPTERPLPLAAVVCNEH